MGSGVGKYSLVKALIYLLTVADAKITWRGPFFKYWSRSFFMLSLWPQSTKVSNSSIIKVSIFDMNNFYPSLLCCILSIVLTRQSIPVFNFSVSILWFYPGQSPKCFKGTSYANGFKLTVKTYYTSSLFGTRINALGLLGSVSCFWDWSSDIFNLWIKGKQYARVLPVPVWAPIIADLP